MAKQIKAIQCPKCGSVEKDKLKNEHYRCKSCNTEYFLDNDNINIVYHNTPKPLNSKTIVYIIIALASLFILPMLFSLIVGLFSNRGFEHHSVPTVKLQKIVYLLDRKKEVLTTDDKQNLVSIAVGFLTKEVNNRRDYSREKTFFVVFFDANGNEIQRKKLNYQPKRFSNIDLKVFEDRKAYLIVDETYLYEINPDTKEITEFTTEKVDTIKGLETGISSCKFYGDDAMYVKNNKGQDLMFYPIIKKCYPKDNVYQYYGTGSPQEKTVGYTFTSKSHDFPEAKSQLIRYEYTRAKGYPYEDNPYFSWSKNYGRGGIVIINENTPYKKELINSFSKKRAKITSYKDLTPDRDYIESKIIGIHKNLVLISEKTTFGKKGIPQLKAVDGDTGELLWTNKEVKPKYNTKVVSLKDNSFAIIVDTEIYILNNTGKILKQFKTKIDNNA